MTRQLMIAAFVGGAILLAGQDARAQDAWNGRVFLTVSAGGQLTTTSFGESTTFERFVEEGTFEADYGVGSGLLLDVGTGVRLWKGLGTGVTVSGFKRSDSTSFLLRVPHPFFFDQHREFGGEVDRERQELGVHIQALFMAPLGDHFRVMLSGGPSVLRIRQDVVTGVDFEERFPFDDLANPRAAFGELEETAIGFNVGADVIWMIGEAWGIGGLARYTRATVDLVVPAHGPLSGREISVDAGGAHVAGGIRVFF